MTGYFLDSHWNSGIGKTHTRLMEYSEKLQCGGKHGEKLRNKVLTRQRRRQHYGDSGSNTLSTVEMGRSHRSRARGANLICHKFSLYRAEGKRDSGR